MPGRWRLGGKRLFFSFPAVLLRIASSAEGVIPVAERSQPHTASHGHSFPPLQSVCGCSPPMKYWLYILPWEASMYERCRGHTD